MSPNKKPLHQLTTKHKLAIENQNNFLSVTGLPVHHENVNRISTVRFKYSSYQSVSRYFNVLFLFVVTL